MRDTLNTEQYVRTIVCDIAYSLRTPDVKHIISSADLTFMKQTSCDLGPRWVERGFYRAQTHGGQGMR